jgi:hypothetical protein
MIALPSKAAVDNSSWGSAAIRNWCADSRVSGDGVATGPLSSVDCVDGALSCVARGTAAGSAQQGSAPAPPPCLLHHVHKHADAPPASAADHRSEESVALVAAETQDGSTSGSLSTEARPSCMGGEAGSSTILDERLRRVSTSITLPSVPSNWSDDCTTGHATTLPTKAAVSLKQHAPQRCPGFFATPVDSFDSEVWASELLARAHAERMCQEDLAGSGSNEAAGGQEQCGYEGSRSSSVGGSNMDAVCRHGCDVASLGIDGGRWSAYSSHPQRKGGSQRGLVPEDEDRLLAGPGPTKNPSGLTAESVASMRMRASAVEAARVVGAPPAPVVCEEGQAVLNLHDSTAAAQQGLQVSTNRRPRAEPCMAVGQQQDAATAQLQRSADMVNQASASSQATWFTSASPSSQAPANDWTLSPASAHPHPRDRPSRTRTATQPIETPTSPRAAHAMPVPLPNHQTTPPGPQTTAVAALDSRCGTEAMQRHPHEHVCPFLSTQSPLMRRPPLKSVKSNGSITSGSRRVRFCAPHVGIRRSANSPGNAET